MSFSFCRYLLTKLQCQRFWTSVKCIFQPYDKRQRKNESCFMFERNLTNISISINSKLFLNFENLILWLIQFMKSSSNVTSAFWPFLGFCGQNLLLQRFTNYFIWLSSLRSIKCNHIYWNWTLRSDFVTRYVLIFWTYKCDTEL